MKFLPPHMIGLQRDLFLDARTAADGHGPLTADERERLEGLGNVAIGMLQGGNLGDGLALLEAVADAFVARCGVGSEEARGALARVVGVAAQLGENGVAFRAGRSLLAAAEAQHGSESPQLLEHLDMLVALVDPTEHPDEALDLARRRHALAGQIAGADDERTQAALCRLAEIHFAREEPAEAEAAWGAAWQWYAARHGEASDEATEIAQNLAVARKVQSRWDEVLPQEQAIYARYLARHGEDAEATWGAAHNLAMTMVQTGDRTGGRELGERAALHRLRLLGLGHPHTQMSLGLVMAWMEEDSDQEGMARIMAAIQSSAESEE